MRNTRINIKFNTKIKINDLWYLYILFLFLMPNDVFILTSFKVFSSPSNIPYYSMTVAYLSILYVPVVLYGFFIYLKNNKIFEYNILLFLAVVFAKDILIAAIWNKSYMFKYNTYEMYWIYLVSICTMCIVFNRRNDTVIQVDFLEKLGIIICATTVFSAVTGVGAGEYGTYISRYHASSMTSGETAYFLAMFSVFLVACKNDENILRNKDSLVYRYSNIFAVISIVLIFATGCRKDFVYAIGLIILFKIVELFRGKINIKKKISVSQVINAILLVIILMILVVFLSGGAIERLNVERVLGPVQAFVEGKGSEYLAEDSSGEGRIESIAAGLKIAKENPISGLDFSFFNLQYNMQKFGFPTFPHSTVLFYYCILGVLVLVPIYMYCKVFYRLIKLRSSFVYILLHFFIHNTISGGAYLDIKTIIQNLLILSMGMRIINNARKGGKSVENRYSGNKLY